MKNKRRHPPIFSGANFAFAPLVEFLIRQKTLFFHHKHAIIAYNNWF